MNAWHRTLSVLGLAAVLGGVVVAFVRQGDGPPPAVPAQPFLHPVELVAAVPYSLDEPRVHTWRAEQPASTAGWLLVLAVDPLLVHPRQMAEPVLFVGAETAERVNLGHESGHVVAIVPAPPAADGGPALDLAAAPIFFGEPDLPERVDAVRAQAELARARAHGVTPPPAASVAAALRPRLYCENDHDLHRFASDLIEEWSPMEQELIDTLRLPSVR